jgi:hypothetical protein
LESSPDLLMRRAHLQSYCTRLYASVDLKYRTGELVTTYSLVVMKEWPLREGTLTPRGGPPSP